MIRFISSTLAAIGVALTLGLTGPTSAVAGSAAPPAEAQRFFAMPDIIVNLRRDRSGAHLLSLKVQLELKDPADGARISEVMPRIMDSLLGHIGAMSVGDLDGAKGLTILKHAILQKVNAAAKPVEIDAVLVQELLIR